METNPLNKWLWWLILPIICSVIGALTGYLYYLKKPAQYTSSAQLQVHLPVSKFPVEVCINRSDAIALLKNFSVMCSAVELARLTQHPRFVGKTTDEIVHMFRDPSTKMFQAWFGPNGMEKDIVNLDLTTDEAQLSFDLLQAILMGYVENEVSDNLYYQRRTWSISVLKSPTTGRFTGPYRLNLIGFGSLIGLLAGICVASIYSITTHSRIKAIALRT